MPHMRASGRATSILIATTALGLGAPGFTEEREPFGTDDPDPMSEIEAAVGRIRTSYEQLRLRMDERERELRRARVAYQASELRRRELDSRVQELEAEQITLQTRIRRLETDLEDARRRAEQAATEVRELDDRIQAVVRDLRRVTQERDELATALQRERLRADEADSERLHLRAALRDLERRLRSAADTDLSALESPMAKVEPPADGVPPSESRGVDNTASAPLTLTPRPAPEPPAHVVVSVPLSPGAETHAGTDRTPALPIPTPVLSTADVPHALSTTSSVEWVPTKVFEETNVTHLISSAGAARDDGRLAEARTLYERALRLRPDDTAIMTSLTEILLVTGDLPAADRYARQWLATAPEQPDRLLLAGRIASRLGRTNEALRLLRQARELAPLRADVARELGSVLHDVSQYDEAAAAFLAATALEPSDGLSWFNAAVCLLKASSPNRRRAAECYRRALELGEPNDERIEQRLRESDVVPQK